MKANREKTTGVMGLVVSVLLHGLFFAGSSAPAENADATEIHEMTNEDMAKKTKS